MKIKKIGIVTGSPYDPNLVGKILLIDRKDQHWVLSDSTLVGQNRYYKEGYRQATVDEIKNNWYLIHPYWEPQVEDKVIVTQDYFGWENQEGEISDSIKSTSSYCEVKRTSDCYKANFDRTCQMIIDPNHGWNVENKPSIFDKLKPEVQKEIDLIDPELKREILEVLDSQPCNAYFKQDKLSSVIVLFTWRDTKQKEIYWDRIYSHINRPNLKVYCKLKKSVRDELSQINYKVKGRILEILTEQYGFESKEILFSYTDLTSILYTLTWDNTTENHSYWSDVHIKLSRRNYSKILDFETYQENQTESKLTKNVSECTTDEIYEVISDSVKEELNKIHIDVKANILYNIKHYPNELKTLKLVSECPDLSRLIGNGILWNRPSQGLNYWSDMFNYANTKQYHKIMPHYLAKKESTTVKISDDSANSYISTHGTNFEYKIDNFVIRGSASLIKDLLRCPVSFVEEIMKERGYFFNKEHKISFISNNVAEIVNNTLLYIKKDEYWLVMLERLKKGDYLSLCSKSEYFKKSIPVGNQSEVIILNKIDKPNYLSVDASNYDQKPLKINNKPKVKLKLN